MRLGLPISLSLHSAVLFGGYLAFENRVEPNLEGKVIPIELVAVADVTNIRAALKAERPEDISPPETPTVPKPVLEPEDVTQIVPAPDTIAEEPAPAPEIAPVPDAVPDRASEPEKNEETPPDTEPDTPTEEQKPAFSLDNLEALVDRSREPTSISQIADLAEGVIEKAEQARPSSGAGTDMTVSELDALQSVMYKCWRIPLDAKDPESLIIPVNVKLFPDGHVNEVKLQNPTRVASSSNPYLKIAADRALQAVEKCAPYDFLPAEKYAAWKEMTLTFRPVL